MIVEAFLHRAEQAGNGERARAAGAIGKALLMTRITPWEKEAALNAVHRLSTDPDMGVRQALAYALSESPKAPRDIILQLAADEADVAAIVILNSPVLTDIDLIDIFARGPLVNRALVAARPHLSDVVAATLAETGEEAEITILLENTAACLSSVALRRIAERMQHDETIRALLMERADLDLETRAMLIVGTDGVHEGPASSIPSAAAGQDWKIFEPLAPAARAESKAAPSALMRRIGANRNAAPALLLHALCHDRFHETANAVASLSGVAQDGATAILERGRFHTLRALFEAAAFGRAMSTLLAEAVLARREEVEENKSGAQDIAGRLQTRLAAAGAPAEAIAELLSLAEALTGADEAAAHAA